MVVVFPRCFFQFLFLTVVEVGVFFLKRLNRKIDIVMGRNG